ncbi:Uncharacterised protein [Bartonella grahamii]|uniref:Uncharacterized protein n=1 Tax=Bartonella grahamii TaxID=33045 RepID=A0A336NBB2_BARGR|nr:Uncharacterised protein [Bartonella grahamii]
MGRCQEEPVPRAPKIRCVLTNGYDFRNGFLESLSFESGEAKSTSSYKTAIDAQYP